MTDILVQHRCVNTQHQQQRGMPSDTLTIFAGGWAYCPYDVRASEHVWRPTGGVTLTSLALERVRTAERSAEMQHSSR
jgi:hypothetical protein